MASIFLDNISGVKVNRGFTALPSAQPTADTSVTVDVKQFSFISLFNNSAFTLTVLLDGTNAYPGMEVTLKRYNNAQNGNIIIKSAQNSNGVFMQDYTSAFVDSVVLSIAGGNRAMTFVYSSQGYWELKSTYITNVSGSGAQGPQGVQGVAGPVGPPGPSGSQGPAGSGSAGAIRYDISQALNSGQKIQSKVNIGADNFIDVRDFGAVGDGVTDDTVAITNALNSASGSITFTPTANYYKFTGLIVVSGVTRKNILAHGAKILNSDLTKAGFLFQNSSNISIDGGEWGQVTMPTTNGGNSQHIIQFNNCQNVTVRNTFITRSPEMGIAITDCLNVNIDRNTIKNTFRDGIYCRYSAKVKITYNNISNTKDDAISFHDVDYSGSFTSGSKSILNSYGYSQSTDCSIIGNVTDSTYQGIVSIGSSQIRIFGNSISNTVNGGIVLVNYANTDTGSLVNNVKIQDNQLFNTCATVTINGTSIVNNGQSGPGRAAIFIGSTGTNNQVNQGETKLLNNIDVSNNIVSSSAANGVWSNLTNNLKFSNNVIMNCAGVGGALDGIAIQIQNINNINATNNKVYDTRTTPLHVFPYQLFNVTGYSETWDVKGFVSGSSLVHGTSVITNSITTNFIPVKQPQIDSAASSPDWNTYQSAGSYQVAGASVGTAPNNPFTNTANGGTLTVAISGGTLTQTYTDYLGNQVYRHLNGIPSGTWSIWNRVAKYSELGSGGSGSVSGSIRYDIVQSLTSSQKIQAKANIGVSNYVNVKDFGATGDGSTDDYTAIQAAINYAKANVTTTYKTYTIYIPFGNYKINTTLNCADTYGICLKGDGNRAGATSIICNTGGIGLDFTGSTLSGCQDLEISVPNGLSNPSLIGIQFALSKNAANQATAGVQKGGLNCYISNLNIVMGDFRGINGGLNAIALVNCRSEEFSIHNCVLQANTGAVFTTKNNLSTVTGYNYTILSPNVPVQDDTLGSMGVVNWSGQNSIHCWEHETPALLLSGVNGFSFHGYIGQIGTGNNGTYETAIRFTDYCSGVTIRGTVEGYGQIFSSQNTLENLDLNVATANLHSITGPVMMIEQYAKISGSKISVWFGNPAEMANRIFLYTAPINGGDTPTNAILLNSEFTCSIWADNTKFVSPSLIKQASNCRFNSGQPFYKVGPYITDAKSYDKGLGTVQSGNTPVTASLIHFNKADKTTISSGNSGYYQARVKGTIRLGSANTVNGPSFTHFEAWATAGYDGSTTVATSNVNDSDVLILNKATWNSGYLDIADLSLAFNFSVSPPSLDLTVTTSGSGVGEGIGFLGQVELLSNFSVNQSVIFD